MGMNAAASERRRPGRITDYILMTAIVVFARSLPESYLGYGVLCALWYM